MAVISIVGSSTGTGSLAKIEAGIYALQSSSTPSSIIAIVRPSKTVSRSFSGSVDTFSLVHHSASKHNGSQSAAYGTLSLTKVSLGNFLGTSQPSANIAQFSLLFDSLKGSSAPSSTLSSQRISAPKLISLASSIVPNNGSIVRFVDKELLGSVISVGATLATQVQTRTASVVGSVTASGAIAVSTIAHSLIAEFFSWLRHRHHRS